MTDWAGIRVTATTLLTAAGVADGTVEANRTMPVRDDGRSRARVYLREGNLVTDGDAGVGVPNFVRERRLMIAVGRFGAPAAPPDTALDADVDLVLTTLLGSPSFLATIEGVERVEVGYEQPQQKSERVFVEAMIAITLRDRVRFEPVIPDNLATVGVRDTRADGDTESQPYGVDLAEPDGSIDAEFEIENLDATE